MEPHRLAPAYRQVGPWFLPKLRVLPQAGLPTAGRAAESRVARHPPIRQLAEAEAGEVGYMGTFLH